MIARPIIRTALASTLIAAFFATFTFGQIKEPSAADTKMLRAESIRLLDEMRSTLKEHYFDSKFRGVDIDAKYKASEAQIKTLTYNWQMYRVLVQFLLELNDSHTKFLMPPRTDFFDYGFSMQMIGDDCFVVSVKKGSDAEKKGLSVGQKIMNVGRFTPTRDNLWKIFYVLYRLDPSKSVELKVVDPNGGQKAMTIDAKTMSIKERRAELKQKKDKEKYQPYECKEVNSSLVACKLKTFSTEKSEIDKMMKEVGSHSKLILDLRGNGGGLVAVEEYLVGYFFDRDVKVGDLVTRKKTEPRVAKARKEKVFKGEVIVLVDSRSASAAEVFSRVIQLEKRGQVVGDVSSGAVMTSIYVPLFASASPLADWVLSSVGMSVTVGDLIMSDGERLERRGVLPDVPIVPNGLALSKKVDPVLSYAASIFNTELSPEAAGLFYFMTDKDDDEDLDTDKPAGA